MVRMTRHPEVLSNRYTIKIQYMPASNLERMIRLVDEVFANREDPGQLSVSPAVMERLHNIHPSALSEFDDGQGPVAWVLLIPTTLSLMNRFLAKEITEKELFDQTPTGVTYDALYLCSALVLEEYRRKGIVKNLVLRSIAEIRMDHPLKALFVWPFTKEGELAAEAMAKLTDIPLFKREGHQTGKDK